MWFYDLRHHRDLVDGLLCIDYDLRIPSHGISKMTYIRYGMKSTKMIMWLRWYNPLSIFEDVDSRNEMQ